MDEVDGMSGPIVKTALVTGASRGIGQAIAARLAAEGAMVIVHFGTDESGAAATAEGIERAGGTALAVRAELGVDGDVETLFAGVEAKRPVGRSTSSSTTPQPRRPARSAQRPGRTSTTCSR